MFHLIILTLEVCSNDSYRKWKKTSLRFICDSGMLQTLFLQHPHQVAVQLLLSVYRRNFQIQGKPNVRWLHGERVNWAWTSCLHLPMTLKALQCQSTQPNARADELGEEQLVLMSKGPRIKACVSKKGHWALHMLAGPHPGCHSVFFGFGFYQFGTGC